MGIVLALIPPPYQNIDCPQSTNGSEWPSELRFIRRKGQGYRRESHHGRRCLRVREYALAPRLRCVVGLEGDRFMRGKGPVGMPQ